MLGNKWSQCPSPTCVHIDYGCGELRYSPGLPVMSAVALLPLPDVHSTLHTNLIMQDKETVHIPHLYFHTLNEPCFATAIIITQLSEWSGWVKWVSFTTLLFQCYQNSRILSFPKHKLVTSKMQQMHTGVLTTYCMVPTRDVHTLLWS